MTGRMHQDEVRLRAIDIPFRPDRQPRTWSYNLRVHFTATASEESASHIMHRVSVYIGGQPDTTRLACAHARAWDRTHEFQRALTNLTLLQPLRIAATNNISTRRQYSLCIEWLASSLRENQGCDRRTGPWRRLQTIECRSSDGCSGTRSSGSIQRMDRTNVWIK
jgi:hypothetical protein